MKRVLRSGLQRIEILRWYESSDANSVMTLKDRASALDFLRRFTRDPLDLQTLRDTLADVEGRFDISRLTDQEVLHRLAWAIVRGSIKLVFSAEKESYRTSLHTSRATAAETAEHEATQASIAPPATSLSEQPVAVPAAQQPIEALKEWIEFQIIDDDTGSPLKNIGFKVKLPTGDVKEYTADADGVIRIEDIPAGTCAIEEILDSNSLEVVSIE